MKQCLHKIASILMAFVVLLSTMSFTIDMHYCGNILVERAVLHKAKGCGMEMEQPSTDDCGNINKKCCEDKQLVVNGQDELQLQTDKISFEQQVFIASFVYSYINLFEGLDNELTTYETYKPPHVVKQLFKIDETYLI